MQQQPMRQVSPDQLVQASMPIVTEATRVFDAGATMQSVLREAVLAGFLMGRGATPARAMEMVLQWRMSGMVPGLARQMRSEAGEAVRTPPAPGAGPGMAGPGMAGPGMAGPAMAGPGVAGPGMAGPGVAGPGMAGPGVAGLGMGGPGMTGPGAPSEPPSPLLPPVAGAGTPLTPRERELLGAQVQKFMQDQANAGAMYRELVAQTPGEDLKAYVQHALDDEREHYRMLAEFHRELTGRTYEAQPQPTPFENLRAGLKMAMDNEYEAFEEYRSIYLKYHNPQIRDLFFRLMTDELEHATRFNYVLQALRGEAQASPES